MMVREEAGKVALMNNLTVDTASTFFVGDEQWLAHNCSTKLNRSLGGETGDNMQARHIILEELRGHDMVIYSKGADEARQKGQIMYYVFKDKISESSGKIIHAKVLNDTRSSVPNYAKAMAYAVPFEKPLLDMSFTAPANIISLDNLFTGTLISIYSEQLFQLIEEKGVPCAKYEVAILEQKTKLPLDRQYFIFHLLCSFEGINTELSDMNDFNLRNVILTEECLQQQPILFRDTARRDLVFMHTDLKETLENHKVTGCEFIHYTEFQHIFGSMEPSRKPSKT